MAEEEKNWNYQTLERTFDTKLVSWRVVYPEKRNIGLGGSCIVGEISTHQ